MCIIDRYLLRQFVQTFLICLLSLTGLWIVFDVFTNLNEFIRSGRQSGGVLMFIVNYYSHFWLLVFNLAGGTLAMVSAMFTISWIQRHNEMTALMAAGVSHRRVLKPIILAVATLALLMSMNREVLLPHYREELSRRPQDPLGNKPQSFKTPRRDFFSNVEMSGKYTYAGEKRIGEPSFLLPASLAEYGTQLTADNAYYRPPKGGRPGGYLFDNVREPKNLDSRVSLPRGKTPILITPHDAPDWLKPKQCFLVSGISFSHLIGSVAYKQLSSTPQLIADLRNPSLGFGADVRVAVHARFVQPILDVTLLFLSLPMVVMRENRKVFWAIGLCMLVTVLFMVVVMTFQHLGDIVLINAALAAWAPVIIFVPVAVWMTGPLWE
ncbi:MAG: LptF/LptG family permease [Planctomycetaceae bacterium]|nr:LptF/LptG family permease [Planctomycetaceae bacterium]